MMIDRIQHCGKDWKHRETVPLGEEKEFDGMSVFLQDMEDGGKIAVSVDKDTEGPGIYLPPNTTFSYGSYTYLFLVHGRFHNGKYETDLLVYYKSLVHY